MHIIFLDDKSLTQRTAGGNVAGTNTAPDVSSWSMIPPTLTGPDEEGSWPLTPELSSSLRGDEHRAVWFSGDSATITIQRQFAVWLLACKRKVAGP